MKKKDKKKNLPAFGIWAGREDLDSGYLVIGHIDFIIYSGDASYSELKEREKK